MSFVAPGNGSTADPSQNGELAVTITNGQVGRIERLDNTTHTRTEISADEYAGIAASYYAIYYMGIRDYAQAVASGNTELASAYYQGMVAFLGVNGSGLTASIDESNSYPLSES